MLMIDLVCFWFGLSGSVQLQVQVEDKVQVQVQGSGFRRAVSWFDSLFWMVFFFLRAQ